MDDLYSILSLLIWMHEEAMSTDVQSPLITALEAAIAIRRKRSVPIVDVLHELPSSSPDLFSNDYLSLSSNNNVHTAALTRLLDAKLILGSGGSRALNGNSVAHIAFEKRMKDFFGAPSALLSNSGYDANVGFWGAVPQDNDAIVFDELVHASTRDGIAISRARNALYSFLHNSVTSFHECLVGVLKKHSLIARGKATVFIAVESLYSMDGDFAPLSDIVRVTDELVPKGCGHLMVDEAHSTGMYGPEGKGIVAALGLTSRIDTVLHTFGKARAASGGTLASLGHFTI